MGAGDLVAWENLTVTDGSHPAYPNTNVFVWQGETDAGKAVSKAVPRWDGGLTKRELFAGMAIQVWVANGYLHDPQMAAVSAVLMADALIAELNNDPEDVA